MEIKELLDFKIKIQSEERKHIKLCEERTKRRESFRSISQEVGQQSAKVEAMKEELFEMIK